MSLSIRTNVSSLRAQTQLNKATNALAQNTERLSSGLRINNAKDDPAGLAVATKLEADAAVTRSAVNNISQGVSYLNTAREAVKGLSSILDNMKELATRAKNTNQTSATRDALDEEFQALRTEYNRIVSATEFDRQDIFTSTNNSISLQAGYGADGQITANLTVSGADITGTGAYVSSGSLGTGSIEEISFKDLNGDGNADLIYSDAGGLNVGVRIGNGDGTFQALISSPLGRFAVDAGDLNNDGKLDLVSYFATGSTVSVLIGNGDGSFKGPGLITVPSLGSGSLGDVNGDDVIDILTAYSGAVYVAVGNGDGTFKAGVSYVTTNGAGHNLTLGDFNSDDNLDYYTQTAAGIVVSIGNGDGTFNAETSFSGGAANLRGEAADVNGDGRLDAIAGPGAGLNYTNIFFGNADGSFSAAVSYQTGGVAVYDPTYVDTNGDSIKDIVGGTAGAIVVLLGNGNGTFKLGVSTAGGSSSFVAVADLNGDEVAEIAAGAGGAGVTLYSPVTTSTLVTRRVRSLASLDLQTQASSYTSVHEIGQERGYLDSIDAQLNAGQSRLSVAQSLNENQAIILDDAQEKIVAVDVATEAAELIKNQIRQQSASIAYQSANEELNLVGSIIAGIA